MSLQKLGFCVKIMVVKSCDQSTTWLRLRRSLGCKLTNTTQNMAELASKPKRRGGRYCIAGAPNKQSFQNTLFSPGITMHLFTTDAVLREKWIKFVQRHRRDFKPEGKYTSLCSAHFEASCYNFPIQLEGIQMNRILMKGSVPTCDTMIASLHSFQFQY